MIGSLPRKLEVFSINILSHGDKRLCVRSVGLISKGPSCVHRTTEDHTGHRQDSPVVASAND